MLCRGAAALRPYLPAIRIAVGGPPSGRWGGAFELVHRGEGAAPTDGLHRGQGRSYRNTERHGPTFMSLFSDDL